MRLWRRGSDGGGTSREQWQEGFEHERTFWSNWLESGGGAWPDDFAMRFDPSLELQPHLRRHLIEPLVSPVRILDVGAGPASVVGKRLDGLPLELIAVDPLAQFYAELLARHGVDVPVSTRRGEGEMLTDSFAEGAFDLAHARNSVDHGYEPLATIAQMLAVVKPGRRVVLVHRINEAEHENYDGLHQWNICADGDRLSLWRPGRLIDVEEALDGAGRLVEIREAEGWVTAALERPRAKVS